MMKYVLASSSPRRHELLKKVIEDFDIMSREIDESFDETKSLEQNICEVALKKAKAIHINDALIVGADTIVVHHDQVLIKPKDYDEAFSMLKQLSSERHRVITGVSLIYNDLMHTFYEETFVSFHPLSDEMIKEYIQDKKPFDKAGAYGLQELDDKWVKSVEGLETNVIGLPVERLKQEIDQFILKLNNHLV